MLDRRGFTAVLLAAAFGCGKPPQKSLETAHATSGEPHVTDADVRTFRAIVARLPGQTPPAFQPVAEVDLTSDTTAAQMVARWEREFRSAYNPEVQARHWKRDSALRGALSDCGIEPQQFATLLVMLSTAVVRASLDPAIDLAALQQQAERSIASLSTQLDGLDRDPRLSPSLRNSRAELLQIVLKETVAYREFLRLLERVTPQTLAAIAPHRATLERLLPVTETVLLFRRKLDLQNPVMQASHESAGPPGRRP